MDALTRNLGLEWGHYGIRTAGVAPGPIEGTAGMTKLAPSPDAAAQVGRCVHTFVIGAALQLANLMTALNVGPAYVLPPCVLDSMEFS